MALSYTEWCIKYHYDFYDEEQRAEWEEYCREEIRRPRPTPMPRLSGRITRTWMQDREAELWRRGKRIILPCHPLRIVKR